MLIKSGKAREQRRRRDQGSTNRRSGSPVQAEATGPKQRNLLAGYGLNPIEKKSYELLNVEAAKRIEEIVESTGLNSRDVLATLSDLDRTGIGRQLPGSHLPRERTNRRRIRPMHRKEGMAHQKWGASRPTRHL